jgi:hypothetical protein
MSPALQARERRGTNLDNSPGSKSGAIFSVPALLVQRSRHDAHRFKNIDPWQIVAIVSMSFGLGGLFLTAFDKWLRSDSFICWLALCALFCSQYTPTSWRC